MSTSKICLGLCIVIATLTMIEAKKGKGSNSEGSSSSGGKSKGSTSSGGKSKETSEENSKGSKGKGNGSNEDSQTLEPTSCKPCEETCECFYDIRKRAAECMAYTGFQIPPEFLELVLASLDVEAVELEATTCMKNFGYTQKYWDCDATCKKVRKSIANGGQTTFGHEMPASTPKDFIYCMGYNFNSCLDGCTFRQQPELEQSVAISKAVDVCLYAAALKAQENLPEP